MLQAPGDRAVGFKHFAAVVHCVYSIAHRPRFVPCGAAPAQGNRILNLCLDLDFGRGVIGIRGDAAADPRGFVKSLPRTKGALAWTPQ